MSENKTLAKNSLILYFRLLVTTAIGLYASRIVLIELGADNYGLYTVVGGLVIMMNFLNTSMVVTSNRYIAVEVGKKEGNNLNGVFNTLIVIHIFFSLLLVIIVEIAGVWYVKNYLNVEANKISDALFVLHISAISTVLGTIIIPFQGIVTAYEKFNVRATIEIINSALNLGVVFLLAFHSGNKLKAYVIYVFLIQLIIAVIYYIYSKYKYKAIIKLRINRKRADYSGISKFFGWQLIYVFGVVGSRQGGTIIINLFFGTVLNAAYGIASHVNEFILSFVKNLNQAAIPQIMKNYSGGNHERSLMLIYKLSKLTYFIMLIPAVPILLSIDNLLILWLRDVPKFTASFIIFRIIHALLMCLESGFDTTIEATGKISKTKTIYSILFLSTLPIIYFLFKFNMPPYTILLPYIFAEFFFILFQIRILQNLTEFQLSKYLSITILPVLFVTLLIIPQFFLRSFFDNGFSGFLSLTLISTLLTISTIYLVGLNREEKSILVYHASKLKMFKHFTK